MVEAPIKEEKKEEIVEPTTQLEDFIDQAASKSALNLPIKEDLREAESKNMRPVTVQNLDG